MWNSGRITSCTVSGRIRAGMPRLTQFQNVMPWVMMAPFGLARGARGVHDGRDVIERDDLRLIERFGGRDGGLVGTVGPEQKLG